MSRARTLLRSSAASGWARHWCGLLVVVTQQTLGTTWHAFGQAWPELLTGAATAGANPWLCRLPGQPCRLCGHLCSSDLIGFAHASVTMRDKDTRFWCDAQRCCVSMFASTSSSSFASACSSAERLCHRRPVALAFGLV